MEGLELERLWDLYVEWCRHNGVEPRIKGYTLWLEERYGDS